jgi:hypothetical protein
MNFGKPPKKEGFTKFIRGGKGVVRRPSTHKTHIWKMAMKVH